MGAMNRRNDPGSGSGQPDGAGRIHGCRTCRGNRLPNLTVYDWCFVQSGQVARHTGGKEGELAEDPKQSERDHIRFRRRLLLKGYNPPGQFRPWKFHGEPMDSDEQADILHNSIVDDGIVPVFRDQ